MACIKLFHVIYLHISDMGYILNTSRRTREMTMSEKKCSYRLWAFSDSKRSDVTSLSVSLVVVASTYSSAVEIAKERLDRAREWKFQAESIEEIY